MISLINKNNLKAYDFKGKLDAISSVDGVLDFDSKKALEWKVGPASVDALSTILKENTETLGTAFEFASVVLAKLQNSRAVNRLNPVTSERFANERQIAFQFKRTLEMFARQDLNSVIEAEGPTGLSADQMESVLIPSILFFLLNSEINYSQQTLIEALLSNGVTSSSFNRIQYDSSCAYDTKALNVFNKLFSPVLMSKTVDMIVTATDKGFEIELTEEKKKDIIKELKKNNPGIQPKDLDILVKKKLLMERKYIEQVSLGIRLLKDSYPEKFTHLMAIGDSVSCAHFLKLVQSLLATPITKDELDRLLSGGIAISSSHESKYICLEELLWFVTMKKILTTNSANYIWPSINVNKFIDDLPDIIENVISSGAVEFSERLKRQVIVLTQLLSFMKDLVQFLNHGVTFGSSRNSYNQLTTTLVEEIGLDLAAVTAGEDYSLETAMGICVAAAEREAAYNVATETNQQFRKVIREKVKAIHENRYISPFTTYSNVEISDFVALYVEFLTQNYKQVVARNLYKNCILPLMFWTSRASRFYTNESIAPTDGTVKNAQTLVTAVNKIIPNNIFDELRDLDLLFPSFNLGLKDDGSLTFGDRAEYDISLPSIDSYSVISLNNIIQNAGEFITTVLGGLSEIEKLNTMVGKYLKIFFSINGELQFPCIGLSVVTDERSDSNCVSKKLKVLRFLDSKEFKSLAFPVVLTSNPSKDWSLNTLCNDVKRSTKTSGWDIISQLDANGDLDVFSKKNLFDDKGFFLQASDSYDDVTNVVVNSSKGRIPYDDRFYSDNNRAEVEYSENVKKALIFSQVLQLLSFKTQKLEAEFKISLVKDYNDVMLNKSFQSELVNSFVSYVKRVDGDLPLFARTAFPLFNSDEAVLKFALSIKTPVFLNFQETSRSLFTSEVIGNLISHTNEELMQKGIFIPIYKNRIANELGERRYSPFTSTPYLDDVELKDVLSKSITEPAVITFDSFLGVTHRKPYAFNYEKFNALQDNESNTVYYNNKKVHRTLLPAEMFWYNSGDLVCDPKELQYYLSGYEEVIFSKAKSSVHEEKTKALKMLNTFFGPDAIQKALNFPNATTTSRIFSLIEDNFVESIGEVIRFWKLKKEHKNTLVADNLIVTIHDNELATYVNTTFVWSAKLNTPYCTFKESQFVKKTLVNKKEYGKVRNRVRLEFSYDENEVSNYRAAEVKIADSWLIARRLLDKSYTLNLQPSELKLQLSDSKYKLVEVVMLKCLAYYAYSKLKYDVILKSLEKELIATFLLLDELRLFEDYRQISYHAESGFTMESIHKLIYETLSGEDPFTVISNVEFKKWIAIDDSVVGIDLVALLLHKVGFKVELINDRVPSFCDTVQIQLSTPAQRLTWFSNRELMLGRILIWEHFKSYTVEEISSDDFDLTSYETGEERKIEAPEKELGTHELDEDVELYKRFKTIVNSVTSIRQALENGGATFDATTYVNSVNNSFADNLIKEVDGAIFRDLFDVNEYLHLGKFVSVEGELKELMDTCDVELDVSECASLTTEELSQLKAVLGEEVSLKNKLLFARVRPIYLVDNEGGTITATESYVRTDNGLVDVKVFSALEENLRNELDRLYPNIKETDLFKIRESEVVEEKHDPDIYVSYGSNTWSIVEKDDSKEYLPLYLKDLPGYEVLLSQLPVGYEGEVSVDVASYAKFTIEVRQDGISVSHTPEIGDEDLHTFEQLEASYKLAIQPVTPLNLKGKYKVVIIGG